MQQRIEGESGTRREITAGFRTPGNRFAYCILAFKRIDADTGWCLLFKDSMLQTLIQLFAHQRLRICSEIFR